LLFNLNEKLQSILAKKTGNNCSGFNVFKKYPVFCQKEDFSCRFGVFFGGKNGILFDIEENRTTAKCT